MKKIFSNKKGAMEMSVGTIVTIVLLMSVLVLGIFLVQTIFQRGTDAIDSIGVEIESEIQKLFSREGGVIAIYPTSRRIHLRQGDSGKGIALSIRNVGEGSAEFMYEITARETSCPDRLSPEVATNYVFGRTDTFVLSEGGTLNPPRLVSFNIPETAPLCDIRYVVEVSRNGEPGYASVDFSVTIR